LLPRFRSTLSRCAALPPGHTTHRNRPGTRSCGFRGRACPGKKNETRTPRQTQMDSQHAANNTRVSNHAQNWMRTWNAQNRPWGSFRTARVPRGRRTCPAGTGRTRRRLESSPRSQPDILRSQFGGPNCKMSRTRELHRVASLTSLLGQTLSELLLWKVPRSHLTQADWPAPLNEPAEQAAPKKQRRTTTQTFRSSLRLEAAPHECSRDCSSCW
jgi:hypothetical protein